MELVTLRRMCELLNVSRRSIQCYEKAGLLFPTEKNKYGHLLYDSEAVHRAERIKFLQELGFKLREIKDIIDAPPEVMKTVLERRVKELQKEKERTDILIEEVYRFIEQLKL
jgi:DNA-binding transcriptional MerR regulator